MTKPTKWHVCPAKTKISMGIRPVWSESSMCPQLAAKDKIFLQANSNGSDQTGWMPRLIWVIAGHIGHFVGFVMLRLIFCCQCEETSDHWLPPECHVKALIRLSATLRVSCKDSHQTIRYPQSVMKRLSSDYPLPSECHVKTLIRLSATLRVSCKGSH